MHHILECIEAIQTYTYQGREDFLSNSLIQDAVLRRLQIMAESTQRLSDELKAQVPNVDWKALSGFRNILVHDYLGGISLNRVWNAIEKDLPILKQQVKLILQRFH
ncbi:HepT-like ribonuclease domain-containing protein [Cyanobacterium sp. HL-69]|uniref:HepT-like ribonuclease domain-containing protein n=1 Tax=Cyanobacterium sp. HL-69 TaxID=2054282 RepID=UPI00406BBA5E